MTSLRIAEGLSLPVDAASETFLIVGKRGIDLSKPIPEPERTVLLSRLEAGSTKTDGCWLWNGYRRNGYHGALSVHDRSVYVHQLSYAIHVGPIPKGTVIRHDCDVGRCWRPDHLVPGTQAQNVIDKLSRGRHRWGITCGEAHHNVKLSDLQVAEIIRRWNESPSDQRAIASEFGCSQSTVWRFIHGITR